MGARGVAGVGGVRGGMSWREARPGGRREAARPRSARPGETLPPGRQRRGAGIGGWSGSGGECWGFPGSWWVPVVEGRTWDTRGTRAGAWVRSPRALTGNLRGDPGAHPLTPSQPPAPLVLTHPQYNPLFQGLLRPAGQGVSPTPGGAGRPRPPGTPASLSPARPHGQVGWPRTPAPCCPPPRIGRDLEGEWRALCALAVTITVVSLLRLLGALIGRVWAGRAPGPQVGFITVTGRNCCPPPASPIAPSHARLWAIFRPEDPSARLPLGFRSLLSQCLAVWFEQVAPGV